MKLKAGDTYIHAEGEIVRIVGLRVKMKCPSTGEWAAAVEYRREDDHRDRFVRTQKSFCERFKPILVPSARAHRTGSDL